jgi:hypothetical protein
MMLRKYILLLTVSFVWTGLNAQTEFAPTGAEWHYNCCAGGNIIYSHLNYVVSEKDTTFEGNDCRVLRQYYDHSTVAGEKYIIKQEEGKIYYYYQEQFNLLFDFDAEVDDIIEFTFMYKKYDDNSPLYKDTVLSARYQVESITTNAQNLKTFATKILEEDKFAGYGMEILPWYYSYTEKIGFHSEFIPLFDNTAHPAVDDFPVLRCYSEAGFSFVSDEWAATSLPCDYSIATGISTPKDENITIYPNPFNDHIVVFTDKGGNIEITDVSGKVIYYSGLSNGINKVSTTHFLKGIYFIKIQDKDNSIQIFKTVKS